MPSKSLAQTNAEELRIWETNKYWAIQRDRKIQQQRKEQLQEELSKLRDPVLSPMAQEMPRRKSGLYSSFSDWQLQAEQKLHHKRTQQQQQNKIQRQQIKAEANQVKITPKSEKLVQKMGDAYKSPPQQTRQQEKATSPEPELLPDEQHSFKPALTEQANQRRSRTPAEVVKDLYEHYPQETQHKLKRKAREIARSTPRPYPQLNHSRQGRCSSRSPMSPTQLVSHFEQVEQQRKEKIEQLAREQTSQHMQKGPRIDSNSKRLAMQHRNGRTPVVLTATTTPNKQQETHGNPTHSHPDDSPLPFVKPDEVIGRKPVSSRTVAKLLDRMQIQEKQRLESIEHKRKEKEQHEQKQLRHIPKISKRSNSSEAVRNRPSLYTPTVSSRSNGTYIAGNASDLLLMTTNSTHNKATPRSRNSQQPENDTTLFASSIAPSSMDYTQPESSTRTGTPSTVVHQHTTEHQQHNNYTPPTSARRSPRDQPAPPFTLISPRTLSPRSSHTGHTSQQSVSMIMTPGKLKRLILKLCSTHDSYSLRHILNSPRQLRHLITDCDEEYTETQEENWTEMVGDDDGDTSQHPSEYSHTPRDHVNMQQYGDSTCSESPTSQQRRRQHNMTPTPHAHTPTPVGEVLYYNYEGQSHRHQHVHNDNCKHHHSSHQQQHNGTPIPPIHDNMNKHQHRSHTPQPTTTSHPHHTMHHTTRQHHQHSADAFSDDDRSSLHSVYDEPQGYQQQVDTAYPPPPPHASSQQQQQGDVYVSNSSPSELEYHGSPYSYEYVEEQQRRIHAAQHSHTPPPRTQSQQRRRLHHNTTPDSWSPQIQQPFQYYTTNDQQHSPLHPSHAGHPMVHVEESMDITAIQQVGNSSKWSSLSHQDIVSYFNSLTTEMDGLFDGLSDTVKPLLDFSDSE